MKTLAKRMERLEKHRQNDYPPVVFLDGREPEPGEFDPRTLVIIDDVGSDADEEEKHG